MEEGTQDVMMRAHKRGVELVKEYAPLIERVSSQLLEAERMCGSQVRTMVTQHEKERFSVTKNRHRRPTRTK